jgi:predicted ATPase/class 3 adenylate cyclase
VRERRVTYRALKREFDLDDAFLEDLREELIVAKRLAIDEDGKVLVWTGGTPLSGQPAAALPPLVAAHAMPLAMPTTVPQNVPASAAESAGLAPAAERRQLTVMFCDLVGSTLLSGQLDPEDLREVVRAYQEAAAEVIQRFEGHIAQYLGDGLLVYFGYPQAHEDDAQRAVHTGLGIVGAVERLNTRLETEKGVRLAVRIGLHTGPAVVGEMGGGGRHEHLALGETPNIAARLEGLAAPNTVVLSAVTARLVRGTFALEELGPYELKGVAEPMAVSRVLRHLEAESETEGRTKDFSALVGRDEEIGLLLRRWEQSKEGLGQVVLISGEGGIGKSSLVMGMRRHVRQEGYTWITFRCSPYHTNSALYPVIEHVQRLLQFRRNDPPEAKLDKLEQVLRTYSPPLEEVVPLFAALLSMPLLERYPPLTLAPQEQRQQTQEALVAWILEEAERQPVLTVWEDLHWADPSTLELLGLLIDQVPTVSMLNVLTFRPEFVPPWTSRSHMTPITLNRLERLQVEAMIRRLANGKTLPAEVVQHIVTKTDGVPLFVEELTKAILESGLLHEETEQYTLTGPLSGVRIPTTLQDSLMARLDRLPTVKEVAQLGAVLGREFAYEMLRALGVVAEQTLQDGLAQLVQAELLYQRGRPPRARYIFKHALIQEAAYASLLKVTRQQVHQQTAQLLEAQFPETVETEPELVAHHYTEAGCYEQAVAYWQRAGQRAARRSANQEAISHLSEGLQLLALLPETPARTQQELDMQMTLGPTLMATKGYAAPEVLQAYTRARELCQHVGTAPELFPVVWGLWLFYLGQAEHEKARELGEQCLRLAQTLQDPALLLEAHLALGVSFFYLGELLQARDHLEQGIALYDPQQHHTLAFRYGGFDPAACCLAYAGWTLWLLGFADQAWQRGDAALTLARDLAHSYSLARTLTWNTQLHQFRREWQVVHELADAAITLATEQRFALPLAQGRLMRGLALVMQAQDAAGLEQLRQSLAAWQATGTGMSQTYFQALLAEAYGAMGQPETGLTALDEGLALADTSGERFWEGELYRLKGELRLKRSADHAPEAETAFQRAFDVARRQQAKALELRAAMSLSRLWQQQGKRDKAHQLLAKVYGWFTEGFDTPELQEAKALLDELA